MLTDKCGLKKHMQSVHVEAKFPCSECKKQFRNQNNLNRHIKLVHDTLGMRMNSDNLLNVKIEEKDFIIKSKSDQYEPELDEDNNLESLIVITLPSNVSKIKKENALFEEKGEIKKKHYVFILWQNLSQ